VVQKCHRNVNVYDKCMIQEEATVATPKDPKPPNFSRLAKYYSVSRKAAGKNTASQKT